MASPRGGAMGAGQAAAAAPAVEPVASTAPAIEDIRIDLGEGDTPIETSEREAITPRGPIGFKPPAAALTLDDDPLLADCLAFVRYARTAFESKFPSHPKPEKAWWDGLRERIEALEPRLASAAGAGQ